MLVRSAVTLLAVLLVAATAAAPLRAQVAAVNSADGGGPRFLMESTGVRTEVAATAVAALRQRLSLSLGEVPLREALEAVGRAAGVRFFYSAEALPAGRRVDLRVYDEPLGDLLTQLLHDTQLDVLVGTRNQLALVARDQTQRIGWLGGRVKDEETQLPVRDAHVLVVGTSLTAVTDDSGQFVIVNVPSGEQEVRVRRLGYALHSQRVTVPDQRLGVVLDIAMRQMVRRLDGMVTTATGERRQYELGNSVATIRADSVVRSMPVFGVSDLLDGRAAGVQVIRSGGAVGAPSRIRIRGLNSATLNNDPIVIVDGVRMNAATTSGLGAQNQARTMSAAPGAAPGEQVPMTPSYLPVPSPLDYLDPQTIESVQVLRGPSAASLYGTDAANGVIVIRTKRGAPGAMRITSLTDYGISTVPRQFPVYSYGWGHNDLGPASVGCALRDFANGICMQDSVTQFSPGNDPLTSTSQTGYSTRTTLSASGGRETARYYVMGGWNDQTGTTRLSTVERRRLLQLKGEIPSWQERPNVMGGWTAMGRLTLVPMPTMALGLSANLVGNSQRDAGSGLQAGDGTRPLDTLTFRPGDAFAERTTTSRQRSLLTANLSWQALGWLSLRANVGMDLEQREDARHRLPNECSTYGCPTQGFFSTYRGNTNVRTGDVSASVTRPWAKWLTGITTVGGQYVDSRTGGLRAVGDGLAFGSGSVNGAAAQATEEVREESATAGWFLEQRLNVDEKLFLTAALRQDAGSAFGRDAQAPLYPKVEASWLVSDHETFPRTLGISTARLRLAWGHSGQQPNLTHVDRLFAPFVSVRDGRATSGLRMRYAGNYDLRPERSTQVEGGIDLGFLGDRVTLDGTLYVKRTRDALHAFAVPASAGGSYSGTTTVLDLQRFENIGLVENRGAELSVSAKLLDRRSIGWEVTVLGGMVRNRVLAIGESITSYGREDARVVEGYPLFGIWRRPLLGYNDLNGDGILVPDELVLGDSSVYMGAPFPRSEISYLSALRLLDGRMTFTVRLEQTNGMANSRSVSPAAFGLNDPRAPLPLQALELAGLTAGSIVESTAWLRLSEVSLAYTLSPRLAQLARARGATVAVMGRNLALWTRYGGFDPEVNGALALGGDAISDYTTAIPQPREFLFRVTLEY
ncbi:MAG: TonB-dependent receptor [Gemmatimonadaceae bacterium]|nr:TonB-dependent receptor [Gemmatimonadaceae bacterium]MCW5825779.1 TonB-dependent receptor [Gemmatimonadaceae bacterium]